MFERRYVFMDFKFLAILGIKFSGIYRSTLADVVWQAWEVVGQSFHRSLENPV
jgi:hypothetical protein